MKEKFQILLVCCEVVAAVVGLIAWRRITDKRVRAFAIYLIFIAASELFGLYFNEHLMTKANIALFNYIVIPLEFLFSIWFLYSFMPGKKLKKICIIFSVLSIVSRIIELTFLKDESLFFSSFSYVISSLFLLIIILLFLWQFIKSDKLLQYDSHIDFWVAIAFLIYYLGSFPLWAFYNYLYKTSKESFYLYWQIMMCLNMVMYILFATGLIWTNIKYKSLLR